MRSNLRQGDFAAATRVLEPGLALCRAMEMRVALPFVAAFLGSTYVWSGRGGDGVPLLEEALEALTAMGIQGLQSLFSAFLAEAYLIVGAGGSADAGHRAEQAVGMARAQQERGWEAWSLNLLGAIRAREPSKAAEARQMYRQAITLATELGMRPLAGHCNLGLGRLHAAAGQREDSREHLATAIRLYREMDMQFWLEQAQAAINEVNLK